MAYLSTFLTGGIVAVAGGMISGSVTDIQSATIAFGIGAIANVASIADIIPDFPPFAYSIIFSVVAFAAIAALLLNPHIGSILIPLAFPLIIVETTKNATESCKNNTLRLLATAMVFCYNKHIV